MSVLDQRVYHDVFSQACDPLSNDFLSSHHDFEYPKHPDLQTSNRVTDLTSIYHDIPETEASSYYYGLRGTRNPGPKLIYRTSKDIYEPPSGHSFRGREMRLLTVNQHVKLSQSNLWDTIRDETAAILDRDQINFTSIDLVRFCWEEPTKEEPCRIVTSAVTIWIGVLPSSTNGNAAFNSSEEILQLLRGYDIDDGEIAFRESVTCSFASPGPILYAPVSSSHLLMSFMDSLTTTLSLPIAGLKTPHIQGSLGFYFKDGDDLYGVTARHVLFPPKKGSVASGLKKRRKKHVVLMGTEAFQDLLWSVAGQIRDLTISVTMLKKNISSTHDVPTKYREELEDNNTKIAELQKFRNTLRKDWSDINNRIIGHVVWSPPISGLNSSGSSQGYMRDVCVIKLNKEKFLPNLRGNVIDIGQEFREAEFVQKLYPGSTDPLPLEFVWPYDRLYSLSRILSATEITKPNVLHGEKAPARFVSKHSSSTGTTVGRLNGFLSRARRYGPSGHCDSIEAAVFQYDNESALFQDVNKPALFSKPGDSGAAIVGSRNEFVAQITAGAGSDGLCDITYGTPMEWLWSNVIKPEFPDATLFFKPSEKK